MFFKTLLLAVVVSAFSYIDCGLAGAGIVDNEKLHPCIRAKAAIEERLKDPDSAKLRCGSKMIRYSESDGTGDMMGVEVNAKNSFGAYAGKQLYGVIFFDDGRVKVMLVK